MHHCGLCGRLIPGAIGDEASALTDCFKITYSSPVYTRPAEFGVESADVLLSGTLRLLISGKTGVGTHEELAPRSVG